MGSDGHMTDRSRRAAVRTGSAVALIFVTLALTAPAAHAAHRRATVGMPTTSSPATVAACRSLR